MKKPLQILFIFLGLLSLSQNAFSRDNKHMFPVSDALNTSAAKEKLHGVKFFFGNQKHPAVIKEFGEFKTNKKTNALNKSDKEACEWVILSALLSLQQRALQLGGDAVINIKSNYRNVEVVSDKEYQCGTGAIMAGAALKGTIVKLKQ